MAGGSGGAGGTGGSDSENIMFGILAIFLIIVIFVPIWYANHKGGVNGILYLFAKVELVLGYGSFLWSHDAHLAWEFMQKVPPQKASIKQAKALLVIGGDYFRWVSAPLLILSGWIFYQKIGWIEKYHREFNMKSLLIRNASFVPCLVPVARRKKGWVSNEPTGSGPWRVSESPMLFALRHQIITDKKGTPIPESWCYQKDGMPRSVPKSIEGGFVFSSKVATKVFINRMGPPFPSSMSAMRQMPSYYRGLAGAFCAFALGKREDGQRILDAMSESFSEEAAIESQDENGVAGHFPINILTAESWIIRVMKPRKDEESGTEADLSRYVKRVSSPHQSFFYSWLGSLLEAARFNGGVLPSYEFLWLRPTNRELWYFLNSLGGNSVHTEGAAPWAHYRAEKILQKPILYTAAVDEAVKALKKAIEEEGWFELEHGNSSSSVTDHSFEAEED